MAIAMAGRSLQRLLLSTGPVPSILRALPVLTASPPLASLHGASFLEPDALPRPPSADTNLRASSFSLVKGGSNPFHSTSPHSIFSHHHNSTEIRYGLQILSNPEIHSVTIHRSFSTKPPPPSAETTTTVVNTPTSLEDFQHEEIVGPTVERDISPVADELRESLEVLHKRILSFQKSLLVLGGLQGAGAVWCHVSWHNLDPTWQLVPSALLSFLLAFVLREALLPISFYGKLEERSRLRLVTMSLMIAKGFASFFNRARILVAASALGLLCVLLYNPSSYVLGLLGILK